MTGTSFDDHERARWTGRAAVYPSDLDTLFQRWESVRNEALSRRQSLDLIKEVANQWT